MNLDPCESEKIQFRFKKIAGEMVKTHLYCRFMAFDSLGPTWERRLELRSLLVKDLENSFKDFPENYRKNF